MNQLTPHREALKQRESISANIEVSCRFVGQPFMLKAKAARNLRAKSNDVSGGRDKYFSRAVSKALEILEFLQTESNALSMNEIAQRLQLSKTSAFRLLRTLETTGYVALDGRGQYKLAPGIHALPPPQWLGKLVRVAMPHIQALNLELTETVSLAALFENRVEVVAVVESPHDIRMSNVVGHILPPNASSLGKVITAFQPPVQRERLLRSFKIYRLTVRRSLLAAFVFLYRSLERVVRSLQQSVCQCQKPGCTTLSRRNQSLP